jgi:hypothetical protein
VITILSGSIYFDLLAGICVGYFHDKLRWSQINVSKDAVLALENKKAVKWVATMTKFIGVNNTDSSFDPKNRSTTPTGRNTSSYFTGSAMSIGGTLNKTQDSHQHDVENTPLKSEAEAASGHAQHEQKEEAHVESANLLETI